MSMDKYLNLANRLYEVVCGNMTCINTWGVYLFDSDFDSEPELRNKVGTIWLCSLLDTLEAESRFIPEAIQEAEKEGWDSLVHNGYQLQNFCKLTGELLGSFTMEEQVLLLNLRNQWTHGYLASRHRSTVAVKYFQNGKIQSRQIPHIEFVKITGIRSKKGSLDEILKPLIERAIDKKHRYWMAVNFFQKYREDVYQALREGEKFTIIV